MELKSIQKTTEYRLSENQLIDMIARELKVDPSQITLNAQYTYLDYDGPGYSQRDWKSFDITVRE